MSCLNITKNTKKRTELMNCLHGFYVVVSSVAVVRLSFIVANKVI